MVNLQVSSSERFLGLDALRGIAIVGMVFSGLFPHTNYWPKWMFHAQVGPPSFVYTPEIPGITWVDLVFPFFLFAMGAAFPLAIKKRLVKVSYTATVWAATKRFLLLVFFAIALRNLNPAWLQAPRWINLITALLAFGAFFMVFMRFNFNIRIQNLIKLLGLIVIAVLIGLNSYFTPFSFNKANSDIIILVLANTAFFGSLIWLMTYNNHLLRMGVLALFGAIWITHDIPGSWTANLWHFHPSITWVYNFSFLKYLCIVLPGSILGDLLLKYRSHSETEKKSWRRAQNPLFLASIILFLMIFNLYTLFERHIYLNLIGNTLSGIAGLIVLKKSEFHKVNLYRQIFRWGIFFIALGMFFEPFEGGIKKDPSSFSYWFLTSGLAFMFFIFCDIITQFCYKNLWWTGIIKSGQNPMIAYVASSFFIIPTLGLLHVLPVFDYLTEQNQFFGIVRALVITAFVVVITAKFTNRKWLWRT